MPVSAGRSEGTVLRACPVQFTSRRSLTLFISEGQDWAGGSRTRRVTRVRVGTSMAWRGRTEGCGCKQSFTYTLLFFPHKHHLQQNCHPLPDPLTPSELCSSSLGWWKGGMNPITTAILSSEDSR